MEKFMYLFRNAPDRSTSNMSAEAAQVNMQKWIAWMSELGQKGIMVAGEPLDTAGIQVNGSKKVVTDGPFMEAKEIVGGYLIVNARDIHEAVEIAKSCPIFDTDGKVEVRAIQKMYV